MATDLPERLVQDLAHHGVKGMRWGVITKKAKSTIQKHREKKAAKPPKPEHTKGGKGSYKKFSDTELDKRIRRLEKEQRYRELKADRHTVRGRKVAREILENSLTKAGTYAATKLMKSAFDTAVDKKHGKGTAKKVDEAVKKAKEGYDAVMVVANDATVRKAAQDVKNEAREAKRKADIEAGKRPQIERRKSYTQTKPTQKPKRRPRNPGSTVK